MCSEAWLTYRCVQYLGHDEATTCGSRHSVIESLVESVSHQFVSEWVRRLILHIEKSSKQTNTCHPSPSNIMTRIFETYTTKNKLERGQDFYLLGQNISWQKLGFQNLCLYVLVGQFIVLKRGTPATFSVFAYISRPWAVIHRAPRNRYWLNTGIKKTSAPIGCLLIMGIYIGL